MTDYSDSPTISTDEGSSYIEDALDDVATNGVVYRFYLPGEDPTHADEDWLAENKDNLPPPAALLVPVHVWEEFLQLRAQALDGPQEDPLYIDHRSQAELRERAMQLALAAMEQTPHNLTHTNLMEMADHIHTWLSTGEQPTTQLTPTTWTPSS